MPTHKQALQPSLSLSQSVQDSEESASRGKVMTPIPVRLNWDNVSYTVAPTKGGGARTKRKPRVVVHPCSGCILPREAVAIMGPSGAGQPL